jgi:GYF domain 2
MSERTWFYASNGQQQGPYPETQLRELFATGIVTPDTLVWSEGMANWQRAADIPGLFSGGAFRLVMPGQSLPAQGLPTTTTGSMAAGQALSIEFGIWAITWRTLLAWIAFCIVIPIPWVIVWYCRWMVSCVHVAGRPNLSFTGRALTILWWCLGALVLSICINLTGIRYLGAVMILVQLVLYWLGTKWFVANIASNGQPLGLSFTGSIWAYVGWIILGALSVVTIIGWAWVYTAQTRWFCRNIEGTRRAIVFNGTGLQYLWRVLVASLVCWLIIPIPWIVRWIVRWKASQIALVERGPYSNA